MSYIFVVVWQKCVTGSGLLSKDTLALQNTFDKVYQDYQCSAYNSGALSHPFRG